MKLTRFCNVMHPCQQPAGFFGNFLSDHMDFSGYKRFYGHDYIVSVYAVPSGVFMICHKECGRNNTIIRHEPSKPALGVYDIQSDIRFVFEPNDNRLSVVKVRLDNQANFFWCRIIFLVMIPLQLWKSYYIRKNSEIIQYQCNIFFCDRKQENVPPRLCMYSINCILLA